jgi:hypothetical protein
MLNQLMPRLKLRKRNKKPPGKAPSHSFVQLLRFGFTRIMTRNRLVKLPPSTRTQLRAATALRVHGSGSILGSRVCIGHDGARMTRNHTCGRFVAATTITLPCCAVFTPSNCTRNSVLSLLDASCSPSDLAPKTLSTFTVQIERLCA